MYADVAITCGALLRANNMIVAWLAEGHLLRRGTPLGFIMKTLGAFTLKCLLSISQGLETISHNFNIFLVISNIM